MIKSSQKLNYVLMVLVTTCLFALNITAKDAAPVNKYENDDVGISIDFPDEWMLSTDSDNANPAFKQFFPRKKDKNENPLFLGLNKTGQLGTRLMTEVFAGSTIEYFDAVYGSSPNVSTISAKYCDESNSLEWVYLASNGAVKYIYKEIFKKNGPRVLRLTFWTTEPVYPKYESKFDEITKIVEFKGEKGKYNDDLKDIEKCLSSDSLKYVKASATVKEVETFSCDENSKPLFWEIKGKKGSLYLLGSIHIATPDFYPLDKKIEDAYKNSKYIGVEIDNSSPEMNKLMSERVQASMLKKGESLDKMLSMPVYNKLIKTIEDIGLPTENFLKMQPWLISISLVALKMQSLGYHPDYGVEKYFLDKVDSTQKIIEFESFKEQMSMLESFNDESYLAYTLHSMALMDIESKKLMQAWKCGDDKALEEITFQDYGNVLQNVDEIYKKIYYDRNDKMTEKIIEMLDNDGDSFVILGAAHMIGDKGIVNLLEDKGYEVIR